VAFVGGITSSTTWTRRGGPARYDYAVKIEGPWSRGAGGRGAAVEPDRAGEARAPLRVSHPVPPHAAHAAASAGARVRDKPPPPPHIEEAYLEAIGAAQQEIIIASAYFFPAGAFRTRAGPLRRAGRCRGAAAPGRVEYVLLHYASHPSTARCSRRGVEIYEYHKSLSAPQGRVIDGHCDGGLVQHRSLQPDARARAERGDRGPPLRRRAARQAPRRHGAGRARGGEDALVREPLWRRIPNWIAYGRARFTMGMFGFGGRF